MTAYIKRCETPQELISYIQDKCREGGPYIFRGINRKFSKVSSSIYRDYVRSRIFRGKFQPIHIEKIMVGLARVHFSSNTSNIEILTDLRHFGGDTTLIDFSRSLFVALFFACNGEHKKEGQLIALRTDGRAERHDIDYTNPGKEITLLRPARTSFSRTRVEFQNSIFVHAPEGYISRSIYRYKRFRIPSEMKEQILEYLQKFHNICENTIYNDLIGFIKNSENFKNPISFFYKGLSAQEEQKYQNAIKHYNEVIRLMPNHAGAHNNRGNAKLRLCCYEEAIKDYNDAIRLNRDLAEAYSNRGNAKSKLGFHEDAIADYNEAISLKPEYVEAYFHRADSNTHICNFDEARKDLRKTIVLAEKQCNQALADAARDKLSKLNNRWSKGLP